MLLTESIVIVGAWNMSLQRRSINNGVTLVEMLIVIAILGLLFQLMLPAIESSREAARRLACANNLRQVALAVGNYETAHKVLPPAFRVKPYSHNFVQYLLPYMELQTIYDIYDFKENWDADPNKPATENEISLVRCPSSTFKYHWVSDYAIYRYMNQKLYRRLVKEQVIFKRKSTRGALQRDEIKVARIEDGLSKTVLFCEQAGLPDIYQIRERVGINRARGSRWAEPNSRFDISHRCDGSKLGQGTEFINCTNNGEIYSFHPQGANFVYGDASVQFILEDVEPNVLLSQLTATAGD
jgi:prepilin-type N-terminal cleavage/methylation domain-containing protein